MHYLRNSRAAYLLWLIFKPHSHPKRYLGFFGIVLDLPITVVVILFISIHLLLAMTTSFLYDITFNGSSEEFRVTIYHHIYYSIITQISPGFTEFSPANDVGRALSASQSIIGLIVNTFFLSIIFSRAVHPRNVFEICPFMLHNPLTNQVTIRLYSKYPDPIHNIEFRLYRLFFFKTETGQTLGRSEEFSIQPSNRKYVRPYYGLLINCPIGKRRMKWDKPKKDSTTAYNSLPYNWYTETDIFSGSFYLVISAETSSGNVHQVFDFPLNAKHLRCGHHTMMNDGVELNAKTWYDYRKYRWDIWNEVIPADCNNCKLKNCIARKADYESTNND